MWKKKSNTTAKAQQPCPKHGKQVSPLQRLDAIEARLIRIEKLLTQQQSASVSWFENILRNVNVLYGKAVLSRLNMIELSKGEEITLTTNEQKEIENFLSDKPRADMLTFNKLVRKGKRTKH